ncbi:vacuolar protein sorting-associated protein 37A-like [Argonauta hians]
MNWLLGGKTKAVSTTNLQAQKNKQIESLKKVNPKIQEVFRDVEYHVSFVSGSTNVCLRVSLPPQFPQEKPVVTIQPPAKHAWVDSQSKVVGCPALNEFTMHSNLGLVIQSIIEQFNKNPPILVPFNINTPAPYYVGQLPSQGPATNLGNMYPHFRPPNAPVNPCTKTPVLTSNGNQPALENYPLQDPPHSNPRYFSGYKMPELPTSFPSLKTMSITELNELMNDEGKLFEMLQKLPEVMKIEKERQQMSDECISLAEKNLKKKPVTEQLKKSLLKKLDELEMLQNEFEEESEHHMCLSDQFHPTSIQSNIKVAVMEADEKSEKIAEDFLNGKIDIEEFKQCFTEERTLCHCRRAKEEKLNQIIVASGFYPHM